MTDSAGKDHDIVEAAALQSEARPSDSAANREYEIGRGKPPKKTQFKKGRSGNPKGRPKKEEIKDLTVVVDKILAEPVPVRDGNGTRHITTLEAITEKIRIEALRGNAKAARIFFQLACKSGLLVRGDVSPGIEIHEPTADAVQAKKHMNVGKIKRVARRFRLVADDFLYAFECRSISSRQEATPAPRATYGSFSTIAHSDKVKNRTALFRTVIGRSREGPCSVSLGVRGRNYIIMVP